MNLPNLTGVDWSNKKEVLFRVQNVAADRLRQALEGANHYVYAQGYADLLAPDVEKAEAELEEAEARFKAMLAEWEAKKAQGGDLIGQYKTTPKVDRAERERLDLAAGDSTRKARDLAVELTALDEWLKRKRPEVGGMRRTLTALRGVPKPDPDAVLGLRALLGLIDGG
jgi:hypothetical protein